MFGFGLRNKFAGREDDEMRRRIREAEREVVVTLIAEHMRLLVRRGGMPKPVGMEAWVQEFLSKGPPSGQMVYEAPREWIRTHPEEALRWYNTYAVPLPPSMRRLLRNTG